MKMKSSEKQNADGVNHKNNGKVKAEQRFSEYPEINLKY